MINSKSMIKIFLTGPPGIGKTTCVLKIYETLTLYGYVVGGFVSKEMRKEGKRIGFKLINLFDRSEEVLADIYSKTHYKIGKYNVNLDGLNKFIDRLYPLENYDIIIIDEIGPMEMLSKKFKKLIQEIMLSDTPSIFTIHVSYANKIHEYFNTSRPNILYRLTRENREGMPLIIWMELQRHIKGKKNEK
ncbi:TPA: NTPase [Candidatus Geothermarchaeota archaeon]|nr:NTPase [Candidatus Geothermarchaeota archaeon]HIQ13515.1 NTPase [Thermoprotei archaeon]